MLDNVPTPSISNNIYLMNNLNVPNVPSIQYKSYQYYQIGRLTPGNYQYVYNVCFLTHRMFVP